MKCHFNRGSAAISRHTQNRGFECEHCGQIVLPLTNGSYRNHCPACLWSKHVDIVPGDRASECGALMAPAGLDHRPGKGWLIVHRCVRCGAVRPNRIAADTQQPDDLDAIVALSGSAGPAGDRTGG